MTGWIYHWSHRQIRCQYQYHYHSSNKIFSSFWKICFKISILSNSLKRFQNISSSAGNHKVKVSVQVLGLGPKFLMKVTLQNNGSYPIMNPHLVFTYDPEVRVVSICCLKEIVILLLFLITNQILGCSVTRHFNILMLYCYFIVFYIIFIKYTHICANIVVRHGTYPVQSAMYRHPNSSSWTQAYIWNRNNECGPSWQSRHRSTDACACTACACWNVLGSPSSSFQVHT